jgi:hypothetical protein
MHLKYRKSVFLIVGEIIYAWLKPKKLSASYIPVNQQMDGRCLPAHVHVGVHKNIVLEKRDGLDDQ